jgi:Outer membrane protein beta-barrel domain/Domain of unknown function (DUF6265)
MTKQLFHIVFFLLCIGTISAQEPLNFQRAFDQIGVIRGGWYQGTDQGDIVEEWAQSGDNLLTGRNYRVRVMDGDTAGERTYSIRLQPNGMFYNARFRSINNNEPVDFELIAFEDFDGLRTFVFQNTQHDYPQKITYSIEANRNMRIRYEGLRNGKVRMEEFAYEREFEAAEKEMYARFGLGAFGMKPSGDFFKNPDQRSPNYQWRPGWDLATQIVFKGRGNYMRFGVEIGLTGRLSYLDTASLYSLSADTAIYYRNNVRYNQTSVFIAFTPELRLDKNDKLTVFVGPYASMQLINRAKGGIYPNPKDRTVYNANDDLKKSNYGILGGFNLRLNPWEKDLGGRLSLRFWMGLGNLDNLYTQGCPQCTGKVTQRGFSVSYAMNLMRI